MKGTVIVIEGTDGSGKKTQTALLYEKLKNNGKNVVSHSFPSYSLAGSGGVKMYLAGELGKQADSVNPKQASILFAADRVATYLNLETGLKPHYENGGIIVFDRYVHSNMIHQACKILDEKKTEEFLTWLDKLEFDDLCLPRANLVFFLDMPPQISKQLAESRKDYKSGTKTDIHETDANYLKRAYLTAKNVAKKFGWTQISCITETGLLKTPEDISNEIYNIAENYLNNKN